MNLRLTRRGRAVVLLTLVTLMALAFSLGRVGSQASPRSSGTQDGTTGHAMSQTVVQPGESLWAVAKRVAPGHDPRAVIDQLADLNHLETSSLRAGQLLIIPAS